MATAAYDDEVEATPKLDPAALAQFGASLSENIKRAVKVPDAVLADLLVALVAEGHVLIEDHPGVGKTALARALSRSLAAEYARIQCTADLLPSDVVGTNFYNQREARFEFHPPTRGSRSTSRGSAGSPSTLRRPRRRRFAPPRVAAAAPPASSERATSAEAVPTRRPSNGKTGRRARARPHQRSRAAATGRRRARLPGWRCCCCRWPAPVCGPDLAGVACSARIHRRSSPSWSGSVLGSVPAGCRARPCSTSNAGSAASAAGRRHGTPRRFACTASPPIHHRDRGRPSAARCAARWPAGAGRLGASVPGVYCRPAVLRGAECSGGQIGSSP